MTIDELREELATMARRHGGHLPVFDESDGEVVGLEYNNDEGGAIILVT